jgi:hypothetical protein
MVFFTFFFIIVRLALNFAVGHYVHYATFMAARAYFASAYDKRAQAQAAQQTLVQYLGEEGTKFGLRPNDEEGGGQMPGVTIGDGPNYANNTNWSWQQGVSYAFTQNLFMMPLMGAPALTSGGRANFKSESWLGREVSSRECEEFMQSRGNETGGRAWLFDNGC